MLVFPLLVEPMSLTGECYFHTFVVLDHAVPGLIFDMSVIASGSLSGAQRHYRGHSSPCRSSGWARLSDQGLPLVTLLGDSR